MSLRAKVVFIIGMIVLTLGALTLVAWKIDASFVHDRILRSRLTSDMAYL
jgi:hypothetical protein